MKKLLALLILFTIGINAQNEDLSLIYTNNGLFWSDSLWNGNYATTDTLFSYQEDTTYTVDTLAARTTAYLDLNFSYDWMNITAIDTGTVYTDSCKIEYGVITVGKSGSNVIEIDTVWQPVQFMRDSSWTNTNLIPDNSSVKSYKVYVGDYELIRARMLNATVLNQRIWKFYASLSRKK